MNRSPNHHWKSRYPSLKPLTRYFLYSWFHGSSRIYWQLYIASCFASWELSATSSIFFGLLIMLQKSSTTSNRYQYNPRHYAMHTCVEAFLISWKANSNNVHHGVCDMPFLGKYYSSTASIGLHPPRNPHGIATVGLRGYPGRGNLLDINSCSFPFIFYLACEKKVTQIFID